MAIIEKAKANLPAKPAKTKKGASAKAAAAPVSMDDMDDEPKAAPSRPLSTASSEGGAEGKTETKTRTVRGKAKAVSWPIKQLNICKKVNYVDNIFFPQSWTITILFDFFTGSSTKQEEEDRGGH